MIRKFRVWDKRHDEMCEVLQIHFELKFINCLNKWQRNLNFDDVELMQSTGLFDKNGVEIYEGDIVIDKMRVPLPMVVKWDNASFRMFGKYNCTVIGNIYENKELLKNDENF